LGEKERVLSIMRKWVTAYFFGIFFAEPNGKFNTVKMKKNFNTSLRLSSRSVEKAKIIINFL